MTEQMNAAKRDLDKLMHQMKGYPPGRIGVAVWEWMRAQGFEMVHAKEFDTSAEPVKNDGDSLHVAPADDEREALHLIEQAESFREQTSPDVDAFPNSMVGLWLRTASALEAALRRSEVPEPQGEPTDAQAWAAAHAFAKAIKADTGRVVMVNVDHARAALRAAGVVAEEPEWEYGHELIESDTRDVTSRSGAFESVEAARHWARKAHESESDPEYPPLDVLIVRRRKAGPWVPVKQEGKTDG